MLQKSAVIDSSVMVKWINRQDEKLLEQADKVLTDVQKKGLVLIAPELAKYEVGNALVRKGMELPQAIGSLATVYSLPLRFVEQDENLAMMTMEIAQTAHITFYDASFMSLAKRDRTVLITDNPKHQGKFSGVKVIALEDY